MDDFPSEPLLSQNTYFMVNPANLAEQAPRT